MNARERYERYVQAAVSLGILRDGRAHGRLLVQDESGAYREAAGAEPRPMGTIEETWEETLPTGETVTRATVRIGRRWP